jgi:predicted nucleic acid-binding protein
MTVVSNTSPLNYLVLIDHQEILPVLFGHVLIPEAVWHELRSPAAPQPVKAFLETGPSWLERRIVSQVPQDLQQLDPGEQEAIALAQSVGASLVLLDEKKGRQAARIWDSSSLALWGSSTWLRAAGWWTWSMP